MIYLTRRMFAPPKAAAPAKGSPPSATPPPPPVEMRKPPMQELIDQGVDFPLGPPPGVNILQNGPRNAIVPKLEPRIEVFAKKLREYYIREGVLPEAKTYLETVRDRQPDDTIEKL